MYRVETHDNSREFFKSINIEKNALYVTSTTTLSNIIRENSLVNKDDIWKLLDIETLTKLIYKNWTDQMNQLKLKSQIRLVIAELKEECKDEKLLNELMYFEDNINIVLSDFNLLALTNLTTFNYNSENIAKKVMSMIYSRVIKSDVFRSISQEILNPILVKEFYKNIKTYSSGDINKIYFYNINYIDLNRWLIVELLKVAGFEIIFKITYFNGLKVINKPWDMVYGNNNIFEWNINEPIAKKNYFNYKYVNFLEGKDYIVSKDEKVVTKVYSEVSDIRKVLKNRRVITYYKDSLGPCGNTFNKENEKSLDILDHGFQTTVGKFLINLYKVKITDGNVEMDFNLFRELITSGWIEYREWNGIKLIEYLNKNEGYFEGVKNIDEILERVYALKDLEEVNDVFEEQARLKIRKNEQKKFLSNPLRALGYNNLELYGVTASYFIEVTKRLKNFILKAFETNENGFINVSEHLEMLKYAFKNKYMLSKSKTGTEIEIAAIKRIWGVLNHSQSFMEKMHSDDILSLFNMLLKFKQDEEDKEEADFSIDQLEAIIHRRRMINYNGEERVYISDLSYKAYEKYTKNKYIDGKILTDEDIEDILETSLIGNHKELVLQALKLKKASINSTEAYLKFVFGNLFINFDGIKELSWISGLRKDDSESIILKQIEALYDNKEVSKQLLDLDDIVSDEEIKSVKIYDYNIKDLKKNYENYSEVAFRDLDFCESKFLYSSVLNSYPMYYSEFQNKLVFSSIVSVLKNSMDDSYYNIAKFIFPLFPQWKSVVKQNILTCEYGRKNMRDYKYFDGINYPKNIDAVYLLKSKYLIGENWKIKNRYNKGNFKSEDFYGEFIKTFVKEEPYNSGNHCMMCPHIYLCRKGEFRIDSK